MKYRYVFVVGNYEYSSDYIFLSDTEYSEEQYRVICQESIKEAVLKYLTELQIVAMCDDGEIVEIEQYKFSSEISIWSNSNYVDFGSIASIFYDIMKNKGFTIEQLPVKASMYVDEYTHIRETLSTEITELIVKRQESEKFPVITDEQLSELEEKVKNEAKTVEDALKIISEFKS